MSSYAYYVYQPSNEISFRDGAQNIYNLRECYICSGD